VNNKLEIKKTKNGFIASIYRELYGLHGMNSSLAPIINIDEYVFVNSTDMIEFIQKFYAKSLDIV
jgi:hypothetical protein